MRMPGRRWLTLLGMSLGGGMLFAVGSGPACVSFGADQSLETVDFCFLFDCQNGAIGGLIDFCSLSSLEEPLFTDCPEFTDEAP